MKRDIIIFGMNKYNDWELNDNFNRSFYILQEMLKRDDINKIIYIDYLPVKRLMALKTAGQILKAYKKNKYFKPPFSYLKELKTNKLYNYVTILSAVNWDWLYKELNTIIIKLELKDIILWSYYPLNVDYFDYVKNSKKIIYLDDDWKKYKNLQKKSSIDYIDVLRKNYNSISNKADYIFAATDELLEIFMGHDNSYWVDDVNKNKLKDYDWKYLVDDMFNKIKT